MLSIPMKGSERILLIEMHVVEALGWVVARVLDEGVVGPFHVGEAAPAGRSDALGLGVGDLRLGQTEHAADAGPGIAADQNRTTFVCRVKRQELDLRPGLVGCEVVARIDDVPAEMPDGTLRLGGRRCVNLSE